MYFSSLTKLNVNSLSISVDMMNWASRIEHLASNVEIIFPKNIEIKIEMKVNSALIHIYHSLEWMNVTRKPEIYSLLWTWQEHLKRKKKNFIDAVQKEFPTLPGVFPYCQHLDRAFLICAKGYVEQFDSSILSYNYCNF